MKKHEIQAYLSEFRDKISSQKIADVTEVMEYLTAVMRGQSESEIVVVEGCGEGVSEARRVHKAPDEKERLRAAELIGKRHGMWSEKKDDNADTLAKLDEVLRQIGGNI